MLGKIEDVHFGICPDYNFMLAFGVLINCGDFVKWCFQTAPLFRKGDETIWGRNENSDNARLSMLRRLQETLQDAHAETVQDLIGKPAEVMKDGSWRILKEVI